MTQTEPLVIDEAFVKRVDEIVNLAVTPAYRRYKNYGVHKDDLANQAWVWMLEHKDTTLRLLTGSEAWLQRRLRGVADRYARKQKALSVGYSPVDEVFYGMKQLACLLPDAFDPDAQVPQTGPSDTPSGSGTSVYGDWQAALMDVRRALKRVNPTVVHELQRWCEQGQPASQIENTNGIVRSSLRELQRALGGPSPW